MAQTESDTLQAMSEDTALKENNKEYVVRGARVHCARGSLDCVLNVPMTDDSAKSPDGRPYASANDRQHENISGFGTCEVDGEPCEPKLYFWINQDEDEIELFTFSDYTPAIKVNAYTFCIEHKTNIRVSIITSGQAMPDGEDLQSEDFNNEIIETGTEENIKTVLKEKTFKASESISRSKDLYCFVKVKYSGMYQLKIYVHTEGIDAETALTDMVLYVYHKNIWNKLVYDIEFPMTYNTDKKCATFDWLLLNDTVYYFEIDWRGLQDVQLSYRLTGFKTSLEFSGADLGGYWQIDQNLFSYLRSKAISTSQKVFESQKEYTQDDKGLKITIMYLSQQGLKDIESEIYGIYRRKDDKDEEAINFISLASTLISGMALIPVIGDTIKVIMSVASLVGSVASIVLSDKSEAKRLLDIINKFKGTHMDKFAVCTLTIYVKYYVSSKDGQVIEHYNYFITPWLKADTNEIIGPLYLKGNMGVIKAYTADGNRDVNEGISVSSTNMITY